MATIDDLTNSTTALLNAVNVKKTTLDEKVEAATTQASNAAANATVASAANTSAQTAATSASSSASSAASARDAAILASQVATAANENLAAIAKEIHRGAIVDAFLYDTAKDSDGGAWRLRCLDKSWYTETIVSGKWLGQKTNEASARATAGVATGDYYQNTTDNKFYSLNASAGVTEVFRGNRREFPAVAGIVAEAGRVVIYDLTQPDCPMWMVFIQSNNTALAALNGTVYIGRAAGAAELNFPADLAALRIRGAALNAYAERILNRNVAWPATSTRFTIVNDTVNDISATVLPDAPVDPVSGLPVPTVVVFTAGGTSLIHNTGTVANSAATTAVVSGKLEGATLFNVASNGTVSVFNDVSKLAAAFTPNATYTASSNPAVMGTVTMVA